MLLTLHILSKKETMGESPLSKCKVTCYAYAPPPVFNYYGLLCYLADIDNYYGLLCYLADITVCYVT